MSQESPTVSAAVSRRGALTAAGAGAAVVGLGLGATPATAVSSAYLPRTRPYKDTAVPSAATRHLVNRFSYGLNRPLLRQVRQAGGAEAWFKQQLRPGRIDDPAVAGLIDWYPRLKLSPRELGHRFTSGALDSWQVGTDLANLTLLRRMRSNRQLLEVMTEFWLNHLHVDLRSGLSNVYRRSYDSLIRSHALGRFDEMLVEAVTHPCMLMYLDGDLSRVVRRQTRDGTVVIERINENLGRELLELHTVGRETRYDERDVRHSAYLLTGWYIDRAASWSVKYDPSRHWSGRVSVLGFTHSNRYSEGRQAQRAYIRYLAHHPATARRIARKLALRFVDDNPSDDLVDHLAGVFRRSGTDIKATLRALIKHPEFKRSAGAKVRTPTEDLVATHRVLGTRIQRPRGAADAAHELIFQCMQAGQEPFGWPRPDGFPDSNATWSSGTRFLGSVQFHRALSGGYAPKGNIVYRPPASWLPQRRIRFAAFVDHLCRVLLNRPSTPLLLGAACIVADTRPGEVITRDHAVIKWRMPLLLATLLDTPAHMTR